MGHVRVKLVLINRSTIEGIMPERRINKITNLQETKLLRLFGSTNLHY
jgi:hypothetical protein